MKTPNFSCLSKLLFGACLIFLSISLVSCGDDEDKVNCSKLEEKGTIVSLNLLGAILSGDCEGIEEGYAEIIKIVKQGKSCGFVQDMMDDLEVDNIDELEDVIIAERDQHLEENECL